MSKMYSTANLSDKELKEQGNRLFSLHKYEDAANCYTKAIVSIFKTRISLFAFIFWYIIHFQERLAYSLDIAPASNLGERESLWQPLSYTPIGISIAEQHNFSETK